MKSMFVGAAALSLLAASTAFAAGGPITATLVNPVAKETTIVAGGAAWRCADTTCRVASANDVQLTAACRELFRKVGEVSAIGAPEKLMDSERLARCNKK